MPSTSASIAGDWKKGRNRVSKGKNKQYKGTVEVNMSVIHIEDKAVPGQPLHFESRTKHLRFADENNPATCTLCLAMVKRAEKYQVQQQREREDREDESERASDYFREHGSNY